MNRFGGQLGCLKFHTARFINKDIPPWAIWITLSGIILCSVVRMLSKALSRHIPPLKGFVESMTIIDYCHTPRSLLARAVACWHSKELNDRIALKGFLISESSLIVDEFMLYFYIFICCCFFKKKFIN